MSLQAAAERIAQLSLPEDALAYKKQNPRIPFSYLVSVYNPLHEPALLDGSLLMNYLKEYVDIYGTTKLLDQADSAWAKISPLLYATYQNHEQPFTRGNMAAQLDNRKNAILIQKFSDWANIATIMTSLSYWTNLGCSLDNAWVKDVHEEALIEITNFWGSILSQIPSVAAAF